MTFALAKPETPKQVAIWCEDHGSLEDGTRRFIVINGAWKGHFFPKDIGGKVGTVHVYDTNATFDALLIWEGTVPKEHDGDFNDAIFWIEEQIK